MSRSTATIACVCCGKPGQHNARGLRTSCYDRHRAKGTLDRYPRRPPAAPRPPKEPHGKRMLARYAELVSRRLSPARIAWELGVGERTVQRYAAAYALQRAEQAQGRAA
ncbi:hypothetical protein OG589_14735 [Sphaerisporangium sp. NBC_01403]|uniref:hypothetical protein n=1 Tax=Sphaerisporangium sp. NBC_01403 TaxID=2903599 RepID=UPI0032456736